LMRIPGVHIHGTAEDKGPVLSFTVNGIHPHDLGTILDHEGVAIRAGHHCAMPLMELLGLPATARASFACYNTLAEVQQLENAVRRAVEVFHWCSSPACTARSSSTTTSPRAISGAWIRTTARRKDTTHCVATG